jgi:hypothetical protein
MDPIAARYRPARRREATDATGRAAELPAPLFPHLDQLPDRA